MSKPDELFGDMFDFNAVKTISTENRFSNGAFDSDVDNFIHPTFYDPKIGTFIFMGGNPSTGTSIEETQFLVTDNDWELSLGFGKTIGNYYLGVYYGGSLLSGEGTVTGDPDMSTYELTWTNSIAVLFGTAGMGLRLDLITSYEGTNTEDEATYEKSKLVDQSVINAPTLALSFGTTIGGSSSEEEGGGGGGIPIWATLGFRFPEYEFMTYGDDTVTTLGDHALGLIVGASIDLDETSSILGEVTIGTLFGDFTTSTASGSKDHTAAGGIFGINIYAEYQKALKFGEKATVKLTPHIIIDSYTISGKDSDSNVTNTDDITYFAIIPGINVGLEYKHDKIALYSGFGFRFLDYRTTVIKKNSQWWLGGMEWESSTLTAEGNLGLGVTFAPVDNLIFGAGLSTEVIKFNLKTMNVSPGDGLSDVSLDLTVSYKY